MSESLAGSDKVFLLFMAVSWRVTSYGRILM
jgi:hypothetical protein